jgi:hypothetical protein
MVSELANWEQLMSVDVSAHVYEQTPIHHTLYAAENRVTVTFEGANGVRVTLFLSAAQLHRLRDRLTAVIAEFEAERTALTSPKTTDSAA